ncbi:MAG: hypothetical protein HQL20_01445 [Candidatus Omnitrophica bacterium]|nr:hypothetical protein [Candidatus Omnitrophota bacterium]
MRVLLSFAFLIAGLLVPCPAGFSVLGVGPAEAEAQETFIDMKGTHFIVRYTLPDEKAMAVQLLNKAEEAYERISRDIGFTRYVDFWTWDKRVKIILFPDQISYTRFTGQELWSRGYAARDSKLFRDRVVVTYDGQAETFTSILPHEIAHLILWDLLADTQSKTPVWLEEGVAQLEEADQRQMVKEAMRPVIAAGQHIPFNVFKDLQPSELKSEVQVTLFYAQSLSIVVFLIEKYGQSAFYRLFKELRDGRSFEAALARAYNGIINSMADLESRWIADASSF